MINPRNAPSVQPTKESEYASLFRSARLIIS
jgi:hypothetical protein